MKNKKLSYIFTVLFVFFCLIINSFAEGKYIVLLDSVNIRSGPGTNNSILVLGSVGSAYYLKSGNIIADTNNNGSCDGGWYEINYNGGSGYVCSEYVRIHTDEDNTTPTTACEIEMQTAGFPSSYWPGLCSLKQKHPTWNFRAIATNLDWASAVDKESACGINLVQTSKAEYIDTSCKHGYGSWHAPTQKAVAFYMDPRNFLTENYIFQFEYLKYDQQLASTYPEAVKATLSNTALYKYHAGINNSLESIINEAGSQTDVSPILLSSRILQELGANEASSTLYTGTYEGFDKAYYGYYNFYNIGVYDSCATQEHGVTKCGLEYAKKNGWNSVLNAVKGGATFLSKNYISKGQYTTYLQKFNVVPTSINRLYANQYMENIAAPSSESRITYKAYETNKLLEQNFAFYIPVYTNMTASIINSGSGAIDSGSSASPSEKPNTTPASTVITSAGLKLNSDYVLGINPSTLASTIKGTLEAISGADTVEITTKENNKFIGTGTTITIKNSTESKTYTVVIKGDTSGDGIINALDLLQVQKNILGTYTLSGAYKLAGDPSGDNQINALDLLQVQKNILGTYNIVQ